MVRVDQIPQRRPTCADRISRWLPWRWTAAGDAYRRPPLLVALAMGHAVVIARGQRRGPWEFERQADLLDILFDDPLPDDAFTRPGACVIPVSDRLTVMSCVAGDGTELLRVRLYDPWASDA
jgi:hypothetical protein